MRVLLNVFASVLACALCPHPAAASSPAEVHAELVKHLPGLKPQEVWASQIPGLFEVRLDGKSAFVTADGKYLIHGDLYEIATRRNISDARRGEERREMLATLDAKQLITFAPAKPKHTITVFTDVDCGYCRKLHSQIAAFNEIGIAVRYAAFPRTGPDTESWATMQAVWCSKDPRDALTRAKLGEKISRPEGCATQAVRHGYELGERMGLQGTPLIVLEDGRSIGGYMAPAELAKMLDAGKPQVAAAR